MKLKKIAALIAVTVSVSMGLTACGFDGKKEEDVIVEEPKEEAEPTEEPETTEEAGLQTAIYTSADGKISIQLPDTSWSVKADQDGLYSFGSPEQGSVMIERGIGADSLSTQIIPTTQDVAETMEQGTAGTDYELRNYVGAEENGNGIYTYEVKMLKDDSAYAYKLYKVLANETEFCIVTGTVTGGDADSIAVISDTMDTFRILDEGSTLRNLTPEKETVKEEVKEEPKEEKIEESEPTEAPAEETPEEPVQEAAPEQPGPGGIAPSRDNPDNADSTKTRTIYTNDGTGRAIVVTLNADGKWVDIEGNQYRFQGESDCYDQNDVSYYFHGEAADVYFLPMPEAEE